MINYIFIDTNQFINCLNLTNGLSRETLVTLQKLLDTGKAKLIMPEIVVIELRKAYKDFDTFNKDKFNNVNNSLGSLPEVYKDSMLRLIEDFSKEKYAEFTKTFSLINKIIAHKRTLVIKLDDKIFLKAYIRGLQGRKPYKLPLRQKNEDTALVYEKYYNVQPDCLIVESLIKALSRKSKYKLLFCTGNVGDFYDKDPKGEDILHKHIQDEFKNITSHTNLALLFAAEFNIGINASKISSQSEKTSPGEADNALSLTIPLSDRLKELIQALNDSWSFDNARQNMKNILGVVSDLNALDVENILTSMVSNTGNQFGINQNLAVDSDVGFSKNLYMQFKDYKSIWRNFADNLILHFNDRSSDLKNYNWLFKRLGMSEYWTPEDIPF